MVWGHTCDCQYLRSFTFFEFVAEEGGSSSPPKSLSQTGSSPVGGSLNATASLCQPCFLAASTRTTRPTLDMWTSPRSGPRPINVTSTSMNSPGSIRRGAGKHTPALLMFSVIKGTGAGSTLPATAISRSGKNTVIRLYRLRSRFDIIYFYPKANDKGSAAKQIGYAFPKIALFGLG